jgi:hypothetical protein
VLSLGLCHTDGTKKAARVAGGCRDLGLKLIFRSRASLPPPAHRIAKKPKVLGSGETDHVDCISQVAQLVKGDERRSLRDTNRDAVGCPALF